MRTPGCGWFAAACTPVVLGLLFSSLWRSHCEGRFERGACVGCGGCVAAITGGTGVPGGVPFAVGVIGRGVPCGYISVDDAFAGGMPGRPGRSAPGGRTTVFSAGPACGG